MAQPCNYSSSSDRQTQTQGATPFRPVTAHNPTHHPTQTSHSHTNNTTHSIESSLPYFGDTPGRIRSDTFHLGNINIDNLPLTAHHSDNHRLFSAIQDFGLDVLLLQELGINWSRLSRAHQWKARADQYLDSSHVKSRMSHNTHDHTNNPHQWGGTGILSYGKISHFAMGAGSDKAGLSQWTWARYHGKGGVVLHCVSIYQPTNNKGKVSVTTQHRRYLQEHNDDRPPRQAFMEDLHSELTEWISQGDQVIVGGDVNESVFHTQITDLFNHHNMQNLLFDHHDLATAPTTYF